MGLIPWKNKQEVPVRKEQLDAVPALGQLRHEVDRLFDNFFKNPWAAFGGDSSLGAWSSWNPSLDVSDNEDGLSVSLEIPGIDPEAIDLSVNGNMLTIQGEKSEEKEDKGKDYYHSERRFGSFRRVVELPAHTDVESIKADYSKGVLRISARKTAEAARKKIPVSHC